MKELQPGLIIVLIFVLLAFVLLSEALTSVDRQLLSVSYRLRSNLTPDSNIVLVYFDNDDITALGGWPLKRNIYALLIDVADRLGARALGIDVFFGEEHPEFPEYDQLLAATAQRSGNVVFPAYFRRLQTDPPEEPTGVLLNHFFLRSVSTGVYGWQLQTPTPKLLERAAGIGHSNFGEGPTISMPAVIRFDSLALPSFSLEVLRVARQVTRDEVTVEESRLTLGDLSIPLEDDASLNLNFPGPATAFPRYRAVEVLRSFELQNLGLPPPIDLSFFSGKIVLIGIIAEGRSSFVGSPYGSNFPALVVHATFLDNALQNRFLRTSGSLVNITLSMVLVSLALIAVVRWGDARGLAVMTALLILMAILSFAMFSAFAVWLPVMPQVVVLIGGTVSYILLRHRSERRRMMQLEAEHTRLASDLRERELKLQMLEKEFVGDRVNVIGEVNLFEEIKRYKREVRDLSAKVADFTNVEPVEPAVTEEEIPFEGIVYDPSGKMRPIIELIKKIAPTDSAVMILGESGTGKELVAEAMHKRSKRKNGPFVAINCAAIPESLLESELFGHVKGAFTGAVSDKPGLLETANGGTVFFDEIAETTDAFQAKLLRTIQNGEIQRVGSTVTRKVDTRILAATNQRIANLLSEGKFREDLYFRLTVFTIQIPPLRERKTDIPLLVRHFLHQESPGLSISSTANDVLLRYDWPGNVRELQSAIKRGVILATAEKRPLIQMKDLPQEISEKLRDKVDLEDQILESLRGRGFSRSSISETADALGGLNRGTVAEYFRGACFKTFFEKSWDIEKTVAELAGSGEVEVQDRVRKKLVEYLGNLVENLPPDISPEEFKPLLKPKTKNLPQRYHIVLEEVVRAYLQRKWGFTTNGS